MIQMKVLLITRTFAPGIGGVDKVFTETYKSLVKQDGVKDVNVITFWAPGRKPQKHIHEIKRVSTPSFFWNAFWISRKIDYDVIHANNYLPALASVVPKILYGKPLVTTIYNADPAGQESHFGFFGTALRRLLTRAACRLSDAVVTGNEATKKELSKRMGVPLRKIFVASYAADTVTYNPDVKPENALRKRMGANKEFLLLYLGGLYPEKGVHYAIEALHDVVKKHPNVAFAIIGYELGQGYVKRLLGLAKERGLEGKVKYLGTVPEDEKPMLYADCDAFVIPSSVEGLHIACLEASACGKPVIGTTTLVETDSITDKSALVVPPRDSKALAKAITRLIEDRRLGERLGKEGRAHAEKFSWGKYGGDLFKIYKKVAK